MQLFDIDVVAFSPSPDRAARQARLESRRRETINKLSSELESLQNQSNETNTTLMSWEQKLTYYTKRFHKITAATGKWNIVYHTAHGTSAERLLNVAD